MTLPELLYLVDMILIILLGVISGRLIHLKMQKRKMHRSIRESFGEDIVTVVRDAEQQLRESLPWRYALLEDILLTQIKYIIVILLVLNAYLLVK